MVAADESMVTYIPDHAMYLINRLEVGKDGKTAYDRVKGRWRLFSAWSLARRSSS